MAVATHMKKVVADPLNPASLAGRARLRRWEMFHQRFPDLQDMRVIDLGGYIDRWRELGKHPAQLVTLNLDRQEPPTEHWARAVAGDACTPPDWLFDEQFDLVYSNSLIEHVGGHQRRCQLASAIHSLAPHHWVQTPYRYFPIEAHWILPGFQFLPVTVRASLAKTWRFGSEGKSPPTRAVADVLSIELLSATEMKYYFPRSTLLRETFLGLSKSLIAFA